MFLLFYACEMTAGIVNHDVFRVSLREITSGLHSRRIVWLVHLIRHVLGIDDAASSINYKHRSLQKLPFLAPLPLALSHIWAYSLLPPSLSLLAQFSCREQQESGVACAVENGMLDGYAFTFALLWCNRSDLQTRTHWAYT